jgi:glycine hydroxymethyltransferase
MGPAEMPRCAALVDAVLRAVEPLGDRDFALDEAVAAATREAVADLCARFPIPGYAAVEMEPAS